MDSCGQLRVGFHLFSLNTNSVFCTSNQLNFVKLARNFKKKSVHSTGFVHFIFILKSISRGYSTVLGVIKIHSDKELTHKPSATQEVANSLICISVLHFCFGTRRGQAYVACTWKQLSLMTSYRAGYKALFWREICSDFVCASRVSQRKWADF